jgi:hypothetical protein
MFGYIVLLWQKAMLQLWEFLMFYVSIDLIEQRLVDSPITFIEYYLSIYFIL